MLAELDIEWEWPMHTVQTKRLQFFTLQLEYKDIGKNLLFNKYFYQYIRQGERTEKITRVINLLGI